MAVIKINFCTVNNGHWINDGIIVYLLLAALLNIQLLKPGPNIYEFIIPIFYGYRLIVHGKIINQSEHNFTLSMKALQSCHGMCKILTYWATVIKIGAKKYWRDLNYELIKCSWNGSLILCGDQMLSSLISALNMTKFSLWDLGPVASRTHCNQNVKHVVKSPLNMFLVGKYRAAIFTITALGDGRAI